MISLVVSACVQEGTSLDGLPNFDEYDGIGNSKSGLGCLTSDRQGEIYEISIQTGEITPLGLSFPPERFYSGLGLFDGKLVTCSFQSDVLALDLKTNNVEHIEVPCLSLDVREGKLLLHGHPDDSDGLFRVYDDLDALRSGQFRAFAIERLSSIRFATWGDELCSRRGVRDQIHIFDLKTGEQKNVISLEDHRGSITGMECHPAGALLILSASEEPGLHIFNPQTGKKLRRVDAPSLLFGLDCGDG